MQDHHHVWQVSYPVSESRAGLEQVAENSSVGKDSRSSGGPRQQRPNSGGTSRPERRTPNWMKLSPNPGDPTSITHVKIGMRRSFWPFWPSSCLQSPQGDCTVTVISPRQQTGFALAALLKVGCRALPLRRGFSVRVFSLSLLVLSYLS